jgi:hypothetical protein
MNITQQETLDEVVLFFIQQNGITFVIDNYFQIREDYYLRKEDDSVS